MMRKTPLKAKTPLRTKTPLRARTPLRSEVAKDETEKTSKERRKRRTSPNYVADMDKVFQFYIRLRDSMPGGYCRCITCGKIKPFDHIQAGHFFSRKSFSTRWHEDNVHGECDYDNCWNSDHQLAYKENLIKKIGMTRFQMLQVLNGQTKKWGIFEVKAMIKHYSKEILRLSSAKGIPVSKGVLDIIKRYEKKKL